jgi:hypothetical protein
MVAIPVQSSVGVIVAVPAPSSAGREEEIVALKSPGGGGLGSPACSQLEEEEEEEEGATPIGARLFQELLEVVGVALSLACAVGCRDHVGVGTVPVLLPFPYPEEGPSSWSSRLALPLARPSVKTAPTASSLEVVRGFRQLSLLTRDL